LTANSAPPAVADSLCAAAKEAQGEAKAALFRVLRTAGGPNSLQTVHAATSDGDAQSRDAALHVLCDWPTPDALPLLVELVKSPPTPTIKILALRGVVRLIPLWTVPDATKYATLHEAIDSAAGNDEKRLVLSALAHVANLDALQLAETYLGDPALKEEACIAAVTIAEHLPPVRNDRVAFIMEKAARSTSSQELAARAKAVAGRK
jgi:HEAT repeat protein